MDFSPKFRLRENLSQKATSNSNNLTADICNTNATRNATPLKMTYSREQSADQVSTRYHIYIHKKPKKFIIIKNK